MGRGHIWFFAPRAGVTTCMSCGTTKTDANTRQPCPGSRGDRVPTPTAPTATPAGAAALPELELT